MQLGRVALIGPFVGNHFVTTQAQQRLKCKNTTQFFFLKKLF
jgi:hypothetical protein